MNWMNWFKFPRRNPAIEAEEARQRLKARTETLEARRHANYHLQRSEYLLAETHEVQRVNNIAAAVNRGRRK